MSLNFFPVSSSYAADLFDHRTDGINLLVNALLYVAWQSPKKKPTTTPATPDDDAASSSYLSLMFD